MSDSHEFPGEIQQVKNYLHARTEIKSHPESVQYPFQNQILAGLMTIIPAEVEASQILDNPQRRKVGAQLMVYQLHLNDRIDFSGAGREDLKPAIEEIKLKEIEAKDKLTNSLQELHSPELTRIITDSIREVETIETFVRLHRHNLSFEMIEKYRNLVNAINTNTVISTLLGPESLASKLPSLDEQTLSWKAIENKYKWVFGDQYNNNIERAIMIIHNFTMAAQVDDDWYGRDIDKLLNMPSLATGALEEHHNDETKAREFLKNVKDSYLDKSQHLGLGFIPAKGVDFWHKKLQQGMAKATKLARYSSYPKVREYMQKKSSKMGIRERLYAENKLDYSSQISEQSI